MRRFEKDAPPRGKITWTDSALEAIARGEVWFDFVPEPAVVVDGFALRIHLWAPGVDLSTIHAKADDLDGIVFVADSQRARLSASAEAMHLLEAHPRLVQIPTAVLYNKRDLVDIASIEEMSALLNPRGRPFFEGVATDATGVLDALKAALVPALRQHRQRTV